MLLQVEQIIFPSVTEAPSRLVV